MLWQNLSCALSVFRNNMHIGFLSERKTARQHSHTYMPYPSLVVIVVTFSKVLRVHQKEGRRSK